MESVIEQSVFNNTRCYTCGALVYAVEKKMTSNHVRVDLRATTSPMAAAFRSITVDVFVVEYVNAI